ncbi:Cytochrome c [hydrothermal vent metagenome]|uniref:Cytochrome c n=1 Tax=hydrothermal vent metagenome TaxID=652676 RepID=A0A3B0YZ02_9ZZZZ
MNKIRIKFVKSSQVKLVTFSCILISGLLLSACSSSSLPLDMRNDKTRVLAGGKLYAKNCASCHGTQGQGNAQWRVKLASGNFPPPPLNGTGHTWHHTQQWLVAFVQNGSPLGTMPAWKNKLTSEQIQSILAWAQAKWPEQVYKRWIEANTDPQED